MKNTFLLSSAALVAAASLMACDKQAEPEYPSSSATGYYGGTGAYQGTGASGQGGYATTGTGAGATTPTTGAGAGTPTSSVAQEIPPAAATMLVPVLQGLAQSETLGMHADGTAFAGQFQPGQVLEKPLTLQPGKCYGVVALGVGVTELDVQIFVQQPPAPEVVLARDQTTGPQATIPAGSCYRNLAPVAIPATIRLRATSGTGPAMAQVYMK